MKRPPIVPLGCHFADDGRLRPARPKRDAVRDQLKGITDPAAAWRALGIAEDAKARVFRLVADVSAAPLGSEWVDASALTPNLDGGPSGLLRCSILDRTHPHTIEDVIEPYLIQQGFLQRTPRGRIATMAAYRHLGVTPPKSAGELFSE